MMPDSLVPKSDPLRIECPPDLLPEGSGYAGFGPEALRAHAEQVNRRSFNREVVVPAWVVLWLLREAQREVTDEMVERATAAVVKAHDDELREYVSGDVPANTWRPEVYARAALVAALSTGEANEDETTRPRFTVGDRVRVLEAVLTRGHVGVVVDDATGDEQWPYDYRVADCPGEGWRWSAWVGAHEIAPALSEGEANDAE